MEVIKEDINAALILPSDARWNESLRRLDHDFYHLPEYAVLCSQDGDAKPLAFVAKADDQEIFIPFLLREIPKTLTGGVRFYDLTSCYGYPSPLFSRALDLNFLKQSFEILHGMANDLKIVSGFLRLHPLLMPPLDWIRGLGVLVYHGETVWIDLETNQDIVRTFRKGHRETLRKLSAEKYSVELNNWNQYDQFISIYTDTMKRLNASPSYFFPQNYFGRLRDALGKKLFLCTVISQSGEFASGSLFTKVGGFCQYHLAGTAETHLRMAPGKLIIAHIAHEFQRLGARWLHLGGGVGGKEDSLFKFKAGFSDKRAPFYTLRIVFDAEKMRNFTQNTAGTATNNEFFPPYRFSKAA